jgi:hypothetical protein
VHHHPGRLRLRADALRAGSDEAADDAGALAMRIRDGLEAMPGVARITHNARTGSLLIEYEPGHAEPDAIVARVAELADLVSPFDPAAHTWRRTSAAEVTIEATRELNAIVYELTGWRADLRTLAPAALAALSAYSFAFNKEPRLPRWDNLLYWSYNIFSALHQREIQKLKELELRDEREARAAAETARASVRPRREPPDGDDP